jgi:hypothetical protein
MHPMRQAFRASFAGLLVASLAAQAKAPLPGDRLDGARTVDEQQIRQWITTLASEEFGGRGTGEDGFQKAAEYVRDHFQQLKLAPGGDDQTYWQAIGWLRTKPNAGQTWLRLSGGGKVLADLSPETGLGGTLSGEVEAKGGAVLVVAEVEDATGLEGLDLKEKIALVWARKGFGGTRTRGGPMGATNQIASKLRAAGAAAIVFVDTGLAAATPRLTGDTRPGAGTNPAARGRGRVPGSLVVAPDAIRNALAHCGVDLEKVAEHEIKVELKGLSAELQVKIDSEPAPAWNVVGILPGSDPALRDEYVVIGSHLDHLGRRGSRFYPGADDDASGTTGVLAVAQMFARNRVHPRRSVLFVTFCGEERGLLGSRYFAETAARDGRPIPLGAIAAELQMDMIGRCEEFLPGENPTQETADDNLNSLHLIGTQKLSTDLHELCVQRNADFAGFDLEWDEEDVYYRSDHYSFAQHGVPIAFFFTGFHKDYHQTSDTADKIDCGKLLRVATYVYDIAFQLATQDARPLLEPELWAKEGRGRKPAAPVRQQTESKGTDKQPAEQPKGK